MIEQINLYFKNKTTCTFAKKIRVCGKYFEIKTNYVTVYIWLPSS